MNPLRGGDLGSFASSRVEAQADRLCRTALIEQRTAFICQLKAALKEYYPVVLQAFDDWTLPSA